MPCVKPTIQAIETNEDLLKYTSALLYAFESCAAQINGLREYYGAGVKVEPNK